MAQANLGSEFVALVDDGLGVRGAGFAGSSEDVGGELGEVGGRELVSRQGRVLRGSLALYTEFTPAKGDAGAYIRMRCSLAGAGESVGKESPASYSS